MKNTKSFSLLLIVTFAFACVMSCDEQDEKMEVKNSFSSSNGTSSANSRVGAIEFKGSEGGPLDIATAKKWTSNFKAKTKDSNEILAHYFGFEIIKKILAEPGCVGIRIYYALDDNGEKKLLLVGVDSNGEDLLPIEGGRTSDDGDVVADYSLPCPTYCSGNGL